MLQNAGFGTIPCGGGGGGGVVANREPGSYISYRKESDYFSSMTAGISKSQDFMKKIKAEEWNPFQFWGFVMSVMPRLKYAIDGKSFQDSKKERAKIFSLHLLCINKTWCVHWKQGD